MINLNDLTYSILSPELILSKVSEYDIFSHYIPNLELNKAINSPLRTDDIPSFSVFYASNLGKLIFHDFCTKEKGDCFVFVSKLYGLNYYDALRRVAFDMNLIQGNGVLNNIHKSDYKYLSKLQKKKTRIGIKIQDFTQSDVTFWKQFGISVPTLKKYNVFSCTHIFLNDYIIVVNNKTNPAYAYLEAKDGIYTYKIYQPYNRQQRFLSNVDRSVWQGWTQLPAEGERLIITKSLKDVMSLTEVAGIPSVALQTETSDPKPHVINQLKDRFNKVYLLYDNDFNKEVNWGRLYGQEIASKYGITQIEIEDKYQSKDFSDMVKLHGADFSKQYINFLIN